MPNRTSDPLFQLIKSMAKAEKRHFKLYVQRNSANKDLKMIRLFDTLEKMSDYDEAVLLKKLPDVRKEQLSNIKAHLYKQVLASLRLLKTEESIDLELHEQLDYARILYHKGLYLQSLKILDKLKETTRLFYQDSFLIQVISLEKKIETLHITRSMQDRADRLSLEAEEVNERRKTITSLSNLALQLYSWYIRHGHARNEEDEAGVKAFFEAHLPPASTSFTGFYERLYLYQSYSWYAFIRQDFLMYYRYTQKWVDLFDREPQMIRIEASHYIKGIHNLLNAHFDLRNYQKFSRVLEAFETFARSEIANANENNRVQTFVYLHTARFNQHFMEGSFAEGLPLVAELEEKLDAYRLYLDHHRELVFYYKIASLYFGARCYDRCIDYLHKIINWKVDLRSDLQCYARLLHLLAHYELGNFEIMDYLSKSVYRFMAKMENLTVVEEEMFAFIRRSFQLSPREMKPEFVRLLATIKGLEKNRFETRSFAYLDVISWLESKVYEKPMDAIIRQKFLQSKKRHYAAV